MTVKEAEKVIKNNSKYNGDTYELAVSRIIAALVHEKYKLIRPIKVTTQKEGGKYGRFRNT